MPQWTTPHLLLLEEVQQRRDEGCAIPDDLLARIGAIDPVAGAWDTDEIWACYDQLDALAEDPELAAREPDELEAIRSLRPDGPRYLGWQPDEAELVDRMHGAWTGRCVGNALGKPVEHMSLGRRDGRLTGRADLERYLRNRGDWPLDDYVSGRDVGDGMEIRFPQSWREHISYTEADDDIHYTLVGLGVLEEHGLHFRWPDVAEYWLAHIPDAHICTAEAQAILNVMNHSARMVDGARGVNASPANLGCDAAFTRRHRNPYREWIGAQIRVDAYAWACAGQPELAAELAWRDAHWTHVRNGIYGAMWMAAMQAAAFVVDDPVELVGIGLSEIPADCRLAAVVRDTLEACRRTDDHAVVMDDLEGRCAALGGGSMHPVHTILNAGICTAALVLGKLDTRRSITTAVMCGADTDCNGASVGSVVGARAGRRAFDAGLADPLHDTIRPAMVGFADVRMEDLAHRSVALWHRIGAVPCPS